MKILIFILIAVVHAALAVGGFVMLLIGLNGFSERQALPGLIFYLVLNCLAALGLAAAGVWLQGKLIEKFWLGNFTASLIAVLSAIALGAFVVIAAIFASAILASALSGK